MDEFLMNRKANSHNQWQGEYKRVLCVCSAGLLRSPTTALVLSQEPYNYNTRSAGLTKEFALIPVDEVLLEWAEEIVCMNDKQKIELQRMTGKPVLALNIPDQFEYRNPELIEIIKKNYDKVRGEVLSV
jgi:predicted protein tyrosine phosphatase